MIQVNDVTGRQLLVIARDDPALYIRLLAAEQRVCPDPARAGEPAVTNRWGTLVERVYNGLYREPDAADRLYATYRIRYRLGHIEALKAADFPAHRRFTLNEADLIKPVWRCLRDEMDRLAEEACITKQDVLQGFLNAVATAKDSDQLVNAWREIGRLLGHYEETRVRIAQTVKQEITQTVRLEAVDLRTLSDAELLRHVSPEIMKTLEYLPGEVIDAVPNEIVELEPVRVRGRDELVDRQPAKLHADHRACEPEGLGGFARAGDSGGVLQGDRVDQAHDAHDDGA